MNLAPLLAGAEGTLAMIQSAKVRLVPLPKDTILGILAFRGIAEACDAAVPILELDPSAIELIPGRMIDLARSVPAFASQLSLFDELHPSSDTPDLLVVEFAGEDLGPLQDCTRRLGRLMGSSRPYLIADTPERQKQVWSVRKVGLGLLASAPGERKTVSFIEDLSVPVEQLGTFVREMDRIFKSRGTRAEYYAHASAGCLHIRPLLDLKSIDGVASLRLIASEAIQLTIRLGGSVSGEHGMGMARSEWMSQLYGDRIMTAFRLLKNAADPRGSLNPGKILDPPKMDENLRYGTSYQAHIWSENLNFKEKGNLVGAIELCNGAGVCRKLDGVMCPSFQATREEMHSTRGRANLLRAMISHPSGASDLPEINRSVFGALDLCLACKGCKAECPSAVDMAKLKYEFLHHYYQSHRRRLRDYIFAFIGPLARIGQPFVGIINPLLRWRPIKALAEKWLGISARRQFPVFSAQSFHQMLSEDEDLTREMDSSKACLLLPDAFLEYMYPEVGIAAVRVLRASGYNVCILPVIGAGRTMLSKGFLDQARSQARRVIDAVERLDPEGKLPVVGLEPSEIYTLRDEFLNLLPGDPRVASLTQRAWMIDEFLVRPAEDGRPRLRITGTPTSQSLMPVQLHGHCYQKAQGPGPDGYATGTAATQNMLEMCGYAVATLNTGCCGMAGAFGYEVEHYDLSIKVGELSLFPSLRDAVSRQPSLVAASGVSCKAQIEDGLGQPAYHPIQLVARVIP
jgi:Fe-S oxidoreductase